MEQFATPEEILRAAGERVREAVRGGRAGAETPGFVQGGRHRDRRGPGRVRCVYAETALGVMKSFGYDWVSVVHDGDLLGWVDARMLERVATVGEATPRRFSAYVTLDSTLRQAPRLGSSAPGPRLPSWPRGAALRRASSRWSASRDSVVTELFRWDWVD